MATQKRYIFDFDSTFIQVETFDVLADISLENHPDKKKIMEHIHFITEETMAGRYSYQESLKERIPLLNLKPHHIPLALEIIRQKTTPSFLRNKSFFKQNADNIYVFSGAFIEILWPFLQEYGLHREHVFGNRLVYDFEGNILGYDEFYPLAQNQAKVKLAQQLKLQGDITVIGDGYNDYEIKEAGYANTFLAFTENVQREPVIKMADGVINELEGLFLISNIKYHPVSSQSKALLLENIHPIVIQFLTGQGYDVQSLPKALEPTELRKKLKGINLLGIRSKTELSADILNDCKDLDAIGAFCIGTNQIDLTTCTQNGIAVFNAPYSNTRSVVELALAEIILLVRRAVEASSQLARGIWNKSSTGAHEVRGKTLGIIGYGHIGAQLSILAEAMGMQVIFYDIEDKLPLGNAKSCDTLDALLAQADVISLHVDGRPENKHFINEATFSKMKKGVIFLNLSRDFIVDYTALTNALKSAHVAGAGLDVFPHEPHESKGNYDTPLQQLNNVILTPHIGGSTEEAQQNIGEFVAKNIHAYMVNGTTLGSVNFPQLFLPAMNHPKRIIHIHENVPGILAKVNNVFAQNKINIEGQFLKTSEKMGYSITDVKHEVQQEQIFDALSQIPHTLKIRMLNSL